MTIIEKILEEHGPMLSGRLGELLQTQLLLSPEAARKQISRSLGKVKRKGGFFTNKQFFIYLEKQEYTEPYYEALIDALKTSARRLYVLVHALIINKGFIQSQEFANYAFSPVKNLKGHKRFDAIVLDLIELGLIAHDSINMVYVLDKEIFDTKAIDPQKSKAIEVARNFIANQFIDWSRKIGLSSYNTGQTNGEFAKFQWAYTSPSYAGTITTGTKTGLQPGFIIADILIQSKADVDDVSFFIEKVATLRALKGLPRFLPFLIIESATDDALQLLKKNGVVVGFIDKMFGKGYTKMLQDLINTVTNAGAILKKNPEQFFELLKKIEALVDGKTNNLRGDLFEMAVGYYYGKSAQSIDVGKKIWIGELLRELDVIANYDDFVKVVECKAGKAPMTGEEAQKWCDKVQLAREWLSGKEAYEEKRHVFELWALGGFDDEAKAILEKAATAKKYDFAYFGKDEILGKANKLKDRKFLDILKEYFVREPV